MNLLITAFLLTAIFSNISHSHVHMVIPMARKYRLDYLDNFRTSTACGDMPKNYSKFTTLQAGTEIEITWHLAYPHDGGFRIELLDSNDDVTHVLVPEGASINGTIEYTEATGLDITVPYRNVTLPPNYTCDNCTLRLRRNGREWGSGYFFKSCADIRIVNQLQDSDRCNDGGTYVNGSCVCDPLRDGFIVKLLTNVALRAHAETLGCVII